VDLRHRERDLITALHSLLFSAFFYMSPQQSAVACTTITNSTAATAHTLITLSRDRRLFVFTNSCDQPVVITYNAVAMVELPAGVGVAIDLKAGELAGEYNKVVGVYKVSSTPTAGRLSASAL
jgi:hypothetical protein